MISNYIIFHWWKIHLKIYSNRYWISSQHKVEPIHAMIWSFWRSYHICISRMIKLFNTYEILFGSFFISMSKNEIESLNWRFWGLPNTHIFPWKSVGFWVDDYVSSRFQIISRPEQRFRDSTHIYTRLDLELANLFRIAN